jgi:ribosomal-protein-alanine N-acetyltransferase
VFDPVIDARHICRFGAWSGGRGIATAAAGAMLAEAFADQAVTAVIAHTLPQRNASNHVLEKVGFNYDGEALEDGDIVWRFVRAQPAGE